MKSTDFGVALALFGTILSGVALGDFVPGALYFGASHHQGCDNDDGLPGDVIFEFDPATGNSRQFTSLPHDQCGIIWE